MSSGMNVLLMTGPGDSEESFDRLYDALRSMDIVLWRRGEADNKARAPISFPKVRTACSILQAVNDPHEEVPLAESEGRICGEYLYVYPPGIPILAPGEYIKAEHIKAVLRAEADGNAVHHTHSKDSRLIACLEE